MIKGTFMRSDSGRIQAFTLTGHAEAGPYGSDIVCSAVSALAISGVNGIDALAGFAPKIETNDTEGGYLHVEMVENITAEQRNIAQILLENLLLGLQATEAEYPDFVEIITTNQ
ncbi:ribosomal-processing cysteine protease Prp [Enterococcus sp. HY326]|uniref:ribosomal-processing cysteine protease Prp n=1 Tax=Enterococcus sp. HY326 TaxID=2971265 RepID=UPI00224047BD|nr:ribosomal-processing cysteine protease Prp [Enterococcus sp. HY326]